MAWTQDTVSNTQFYTAEISHYAFALDLGTYDPQQRAKVIGACCLTAGYTFEIDGILHLHL